MTKIEKAQRHTNVSEVLDKMKKDNTLTREYMFSSSLITYFLCLVFFAVSFIFNTGIVVIPVLYSETFTKVLDLIVKVGSISLFYFFAIIAVGNLLEFKGKIMDWKALLFIMLLSLIQGVSSFTIFFVSLLSIMLINFYFYLMQSHT